jgi:hypothetical protein
MVVNRENYIGEIEKIVGKIEDGYRKHPFRVKSYEYRNTGNSIAYSLLAELADNNMR